MCQIQYIIIIKLYITVHSNTEPSTVTTFPGYKGLIPRKTAGTVFLYMGNILLEALINILLNYHKLIYNKYTSEIVFNEGLWAIAGWTFYMVLINEASLINKQVFK